MLIFPPNGDHAACPVSSYKTMRTFGAPAGAVGSSYGLQSCFESRTSSLITPLNSLLITRLLSSVTRLVALAAGSTSEAQQHAQQPQHAEHGHQRRHERGERVGLRPEFRLKPLPVLPVLDRGQQQSRQADADHQQREAARADQAF